MNERPKRKEESLSGEKNLIVIRNIERSVVPCLVKVFSTL